MAVSLIKFRYNLNETIGFEFVPLCEVPFFELHGP